VPFQFPLLQPGDWAEIAGLGRIAHELLDRHFEIVITALSLRRTKIVADGRGELANDAVPHPFERVSLDLQGLAVYWPRIRSLICGPFGCDGERISGPLSVITYG
jgi:hypothetical protein